MKEPRTIYEDKNFVAVYKPAGLLVHPSLRGGTRSAKESTLVDWLLSRYPEIKNIGDNPRERPGIVHRLDKETSGILLVARNQKYFEYLKSLFMSREIKKMYHALVWGKVEPKRGIIDVPIGIKSGSLKRSVHSKKFMKDAVTEYHVREYLEGVYGEFSLLELFPETGRTHQLRVHLGSRGHPIVGDSLYGKKANARLKIIGILPLMLHASSLEFTARDGKRIRIEAEPSEDFKKIAHLLGGGSV